MNEKLRDYFRRFLEAGAFCTPPGRAACALDNARTLLEWEALEADGLVRLRAGPECESHFDIFGEPEGYVNIHGRHVTVEQARAEIVERIERDGNWWVVSEYFDGQQWQQADSIGSCIYENPLSPFENCYVPDLTRSAIDALKAQAEAEVWL